MDNINQYAEQLLKDKNIPELDDAIHKQLVSDLSNRLIDFINRRVVESMPAEAVNEFNKLLDGQPSPDQVQEFINNNVPDKDKIILNAMIEFRAAYIGTGT